MDRLSIVWILGAIVMLLFGELIPAALASTRPETAGDAHRQTMSLLLTCCRCIAFAALVQQPGGDAFRDEIRHPM